MGLLPDHFVGINRMVGNNRFNVRRGALCKGGRDLQQCRSVPPHRLERSSEAVICDQGAELCESR